jgi:hypothetical protein
MAKKVRGSHRGDLANARKLTIARSVAIALLKEGVYTMYIPRKYRASTEHVRKLTDTVVNCS